MQKLYNLRIYLPKGNIMRTVGAAFTPETTLLIQGVKGKIDANGVITDAETLQAVEHFLQSFTNHVNTSIQRHG